MERRSSPEIPCNPAHPIVKPTESIPLFRIFDKGVNVFPSQIEAETN